MNSSVSTLSAQDIEALALLCAEDSHEFARTFFPKTVRQESPQFHRDLDDLLEKSPKRFVNAQIFRGGAKTTKLRLYTAKRIAYGMSRTILYIGKSEGHALRSVRWLLKQIELNHLFSETFQLKKGSKWQPHEAEIIHGIDETSIWILGMGITGSTRGINLDDYRPDTIIVDDVIDEDNAATVEQRQKIADLIHGALKHSLAPRSEAPSAKMVMLQTPLNVEDASTQALKDPSWDSIVRGCWTEDTKDLPTHLQMSAWEDRYPTEELRKEKEDEIQANRLSTWLREKECKLVSSETASFRTPWLKFFEPATLQELYSPETPKVLHIDPVPPPTDRALQKGLHRRDYEALAVVAKLRGNFYVLEYALKRGHAPDWTVAEFFRLAEKYNPFRVLVETTAYQAVLAWLLRKAMDHHQRYFVITELDDKRKKFNVIVDSLQGVASAGHLYCQKHHTDLIEQFNTYPDVANDDILEAVARCVGELQAPMYKAFGNGDQNNPLIAGQDVNLLTGPIEYGSNYGAP